MRGQADRGGQEACNCHLRETEKERWWRGSRQRIRDNRAGNKCSTNCCLGTITKLLSCTLIDLGPPNSAPVYLPPPSSRQTQVVLCKLIALRLMPIGLSPPQVPYNVAFKNKTSEDVSLLVVDSIVDVIFFIDIGKYHSLSLSTSLSITHLLSSLASQC